MTPKVMTMAVSTIACGSGSAVPAPAGAVGAADERAPRRPARPRRAAAGWRRAEQAQAEHDAGQRALQQQVGADGVEHADEQREREVAGHSLRLRAEGAQHAASTRPTTTRKTPMSKRQRAGRLDDAEHRHVELDVAALEELRRRAASAAAPVPAASSSPAPSGSAGSTGTAAAEPVAAGRRRSAARRRSPATRPPTKPPPGWLWPANSR